MKNTNETAKSPLTYFKRVKEPLKKPEDAEEFKKETRLYLLVSLAVAVVSGILMTVLSSVPVLPMIFTLLGLVSMILVIVFAIMMYGIKVSLKRLQNLTCESCGAALGYDENTSWEEVRRYWSDRNNDNVAKSLLYVDVNITCVCPNCGKAKTFTEKLCAGEIKVTNDLNTTENIVSTQSLVADYFKGVVHK